MNMIIKFTLGVIINSMSLLSYNLNNNGEDCGPTYEATDRGIIALHKYNDNRLIVGGAFSKIYKNTSSEENIYRLAEANLSSGGCTLHNQFNFTFNTDENDNEGWIRALASYRNYLFIGGDFDIINGVPRRGLAIVDLDSNQLLDWNPNIGVQFNGSTDSDGISVHTLKVDLTNKTLHVGGDFLTPYKGYIQYDISSLDNNDVNNIQLNHAKSGLDGDVWSINKDQSTGKLYMVGSFTNKFAEITNNNITSYNIGFTGTPYSMAIKPGSKIFIGGDSNEFKAIQLPTYTNDNTWTPSIAGTIRYERWGSSTFKMAYVDDDNIIIGVNGLNSINGENITQVGSVDASVGATSTWRQNKIYSGDYLHALLNTNDWLYLSASSVRFARFQKQHLGYPEISINNISKNECTAPTVINPFDFTLTLDSPAPIGGATIYYTIGDDTAKSSDNDYAYNEGTIFFNAGESIKTLTVNINCDTKIEENENFDVILSSPLNLTIANNKGIGTIENDDVISTPVVTQIVTATNVNIGNRVWIENDNDGDATTGIITALEGILVTATASNGQIYTALTNSQGYYLISVPKNDTYIVTINTPTGHVATANSNDNSILDSTSEENLSHDGTGTSVLVTDTDNLSVDFGFRTTVVLATSQTTCQEMTLKDDINNANESNSTTIIDVLDNDIGLKEGRTIKLLSTIEGKTFWEQQSTIVTTPTTLTTLDIPNEGTWKIENNKIIFTALNSFDGKIPSPIYYIIEGDSTCSLNTKYTNVAKVSIDTACNCPNYTTRSASSFNAYSLIGLIFITYILIFFYKDEI